MNGEWTETLRGFFQEVGTFVGDDTTGRGVVTCAAAGTAILLGVWRVLRRRHPLPLDQRVRVNVDAPKGQNVRIELADGDEEE